MCGIVAYFGGAGNNLTRILTAMSAIIYRAPDSTGVGLWGDDADSLRTRKSLGSVANLVPVLLDDPVYPNPTADLLSVFIPESGGVTGPDLQRRLLDFEGFAPQNVGVVNPEQPQYPSFDDLVELEPCKAIRIAPGVAGRTTVAPDQHIRSQKDLRKVIQHLIVTYDLSPLVIQILIRSSLDATLRQIQAQGDFQVEPTDILSAFDRQFDQCLSGEKVPHPQRLDDQRFPQNPSIGKYLWRCLTATAIKIPADFDRDGVRCLLRLLDAALLSRLPHHSDLEESLNVTLAELWPPAGSPGAIDWKTLYRAEKAINVYGRAGGAALAFLQREEFIPQMLKNVSGNGRSQSASAVVPGQTDPICLRYFALPVIAQGRWSMQAPVTLRNAHPFFDERKQRLIALNGQFDAGLESELRKFLTRVAGISLRSENSSEYLALLWGYYYHQLTEDKRRFEIIKSQVEAGFEKTIIGSQAIDYRLFHRVQGKSAVELDALAFIEAARQMIRRGGQVAATGMSLLSPRRLYVVSHNRPIFIVRRLENNDVMVVSDINAAMGLFPHALIHQQTLKLVKLRKEKHKALEELKAAGATKVNIRNCKAKFNRRKEKLLEVFKVAVYPLVGEEIFAEITTNFENQTLGRDVIISDFDGRLRPEFESSLTILQPPAIRKDLYPSYYESHLHEIPERMTEILNYYIPGDNELPEFQIREDLIKRHFGSKLSTLKRLVLVGVAGAYNMALIARSFIRKLLPDTEILVLMPAEAEDLAEIIDSDTDLVVLLCWSGTTADMVAFANSLQSHKSVMIAITEKSFADMALIAQKSGGVIPVLSGEEVTVSDIKSTACLLFCLYLFVIWLASQKGRRKTAITQLKTLQRVPEIVSGVISDNSLDAFSENLASQSGQSYAAVVLDALATIGTGREVASKLEEMSWTAIGSALDYRDVQPEALCRDLNKNLILVNATSKARFCEALGLMKTLFEKGLPFAAVTYSNRELRDIRRYSRNNVVCLPKIEDALQPFIDLVFYYRLALHYGVAHGRNAEDFPRNRVKSVTASRSFAWPSSSAAGELLLLKENNQVTANPAVRRKSGSKGNSWEFRAHLEWEKKYYGEMRRLAEMFHDPDPLKTLLQKPARVQSSLTKIVSHIIASEGEILFMPLDRKASAAIRNIVTNWRRILGCRLKIVDIHYFSPAFSNNALFVAVAAQPPDEALLLQALPKNRSPQLWIGPKLPAALRQIFRESAGCCILGPGGSLNRADLIYAGISMLLAHCWKNLQPTKAETVQKHLMHTADIVDSMINDVSIINSAAQAMAANRGYKTAFFLGPPVGAGIIWAEIFKQAGGPLLEYHLFGESAHGPVVTVDSKVDDKFVKLENRKRMVLNFGKRNLLKWERIYLGGTKIDRFLSRPIEHQPAGINRPFFAQDNWYLPLLRSNFDSAQDNLIIIDATSERYFPHAMDELATYGCRYARMIVLSQAAFRKDVEKNVLYQYPISHLIELPAFNGNTGKSSPISDFLLPFAMNLLGTAMAAAASGYKI